MSQKCLTQKPSWDGSCDDCNYKNCDDCKKTHKVIGIVGNRTGWDLLEVFENLKQTGLVTKDDAIVSGGAMGVDTFAQIYARENGIPILICYPDPKNSSPQKFYERNGTIARLSDILIAFNLKNARTGTYNTMMQAKKMGKKIILFEKQV